MKVNRKKNFEIQKICKVWEVRCEDGGMLSEEREWAVWCDAREWAVWCDPWEKNL